MPSWVPDGATFFITVNCVPRGQNQLAAPAAADALMESLIVRIEKGQWWPRLVLFMPDHLHALISFSPYHSIEKIVRDWKRYTARKAGIRWQRDFFDHRIRNEESLTDKWNYILQNPVRAALVPTQDAWPYVWINGEDSDGKGRDGSPSRPSAIARPDKAFSGAFGEHALPIFFNHLPRLTTRSEHIRQLRQTILSLAVRGKLVPQDPRDEPAVELLKKIPIEVLIPFPPLAEQHRIVAKVDELMALCDELEVRITATSNTRRQLLEATIHNALHVVEDSPS